MTLKLTRTPGSIRASGHPIGPGDRPAVPSTAGAHGAETGGMLDHDRRRGGTSGEFGCPRGEFGIDMLVVQLDGIFDGKPSLTRRIPGRRGTAGTAGRQPGSELRTAGQPAAHTTSPGSRSAAADTGPSMDGTDRRARIVRV